MGVDEFSWDNSRSVVKELFPVSPFILYNQVEARLWVPYGRHMG